MKRLLFFLLIFNALVFAEDTYVLLKGYLGEDNLSFAQQKINAVREVDGGRLILQVNSSSGDLRASLSLAQEIYDIKMRSNKYVIIYIEGKAVGPAAVFPFLADEMIVTPLVAWGDIPYGVKDQMTLERMRRSVSSLINRNRSHAPTLYKLADAMIDPHYQLIYQNGQGVIEKEKKEQFDPLVLNLKGMKSLGVVDEVMDDKTFADSYVRVKEEQTEYSRVVSAAEFNEEFEKYVSYSKTEQNLIGYIRIDNKRSINQATYIYVKFALKDFIKKGVRFVVLDLDTPGGEVLAALKIVDLLQKLDVQYHIPVVAFIDNWAVSAGAMLAYSSRFIGVLPSSLMGAAEPVILGKEGQMVSASEKVNSALRAEISNLASFYGRNPLIAEAMVDKDLILVLRNHKIVKLKSESEVINTGSSPDVIISGRGKLITLNSKQMIDLGIADFEVPFKPVPEITDKEWNKGVWPASKVLIFEEPTLNKIPHAVMIDYQDWRVGFFTVLTHPIVATLLFVGLVIGLYIEINTPGFGVPGSIALGCLALILLSSFASHAINWIEIIIVCVGLILLALELFVIPGFGITGILGIILTIIGLFALMLPGIDRLNFLEPETFKLVGVAFIERLAWLCGGLVFAIVMIILMARFFSHRFFRFSKLILKGEQEKKEGYVSGIPRELMPEEGELGETVTPLRPSGKVHIGDNLYNAVCLTGYLETNTTVEVVKIEGSKIVVKPLKEQRDFSC
ncbi:MAG: serine protease [Simkaniaceae bacterium]|nr:MAG: serine protease [Simkaniaceae bacterium]